MFEFEFLRNALVGSILCGVSLSLIGVLLVLLNIPFLGICLSHAAFLGAVIAVVAGVHPLAGALIACMLATLTVWPVAESTRAGPNGAMSVVMAGTMGLAFVFMSRIPGPKSEALMLIWGSVLTLTRMDLASLLAVAVAVPMLIMVFYRQLAAVLYDREIAFSCGVPARGILFGVLVFAGAAVSVSLDIIGGLLIFALLVNPASAAYHLTGQLKWMFTLAVVFGVTSTVGGLWLSCLFDIPTGAVMAVISTLIFLLALVCKPVRPGSVIRPSFAEQASDTVPIVRRG